MEKAKYVKDFASLKEAVDYLGSDIVLSEIGVIRKLRNGKWKIRMVVDSKRSGVSRATRKFERTLLPRALDVVTDALALLKDLGDGEELEFLVADFRDAFFI